MSSNGWRERAVERSLRTARERAVWRSERFISAATELLHESGSFDFTVQDLVVRAQMSLRSFYQHFGSKDELLLAVFEEVIRSYTTSLREEVLADPDPAEQLRRYITGFFKAGESSDRGASVALSRFRLNLTQGDPAELARVFEPQIALLHEIITAGVASGQVRSDIPASVLSMLVTHTLMSTVEMNLLGSHLTGDQLTAQQLHEFCTSGVMTRG
jgi:AcrR family transcriptional regulator